MQQTFNFDELLQSAESAVPPLFVVPMLEQRDGKYVPTPAWSGVLEAFQQTMFPEIPAAERWSGLSVQKMGLNKV